MQEFGENDHVVVLSEPVRGISPAMKLGEKGVSLCTVTCDAGGEGIELERCESGSSAGAMVLHKKGSTRHPGPVRVSNPAYCKSWEEMFGKRKPSSSGDQPN